MNRKPQAIAHLAALAALAALIACPVAQAGEVIAHPGLDVSAADVREAFTGEKQLAGGVKLVPVDNSSAQTDFLAKVVQMEAPRYVSMWTKKSFREGLTAPPTKGGDAEVIAFVKATPGAIGYVSAGAAGVKSVMKY